MQINIEDKMVVATMTEREAGKIMESLDSMPSIPADLKPFQEVFKGISIPGKRRGEVRHEWGDPLDLDPDIGPA
ncbi:hypothetical protein [Acidithiobacillus sulfurivorans]|uniref:Uncharacterized protein n=1 Tax=Acidithiobacillus sulfurivorans TaxID=1958756 RepID=A0ABS6A141_9PROT|nr:hypothetical protein [Acidithiobacillus sulfurivorans]MBU2761227.1 hypothetical protein [Acidithiobacillus sulfurivorans]